MSPRSGRQNLAHRQISVALTVLLIVFCFGCNRGTGGGIGSGTGGLPPASSTPAEVSSSAQVVKVKTSPAAIAKGGAADTTINLTVASGYHVNANPATYSYLIATEVKPGTSEGITVGAPIYPPATKQKFEFAEEPLAVYEGNIEIKLPLKINATTVGERVLPITVRVQACDTEKCFPPATINTTISVLVK